MRAKLPTPIAWMFYSLLKLTSLAGENAEPLYLLVCTGTNSLFLGLPSDRRNTEIVAISSPCLSRVLGGVGASGRVPCGYASRSARHPGTPKIHRGRQPAGAGVEGLFQSLLALSFVEGLAEAFA